MGVLGEGMHRARSRQEPHWSGLSLVCLAEEGAFYPGNDEGPLVHFVKGNDVYLHFRTFTLTAEEGWEFRCGQAEEAVTAS